jgi:transcriptional regulator with XRE-family HTH domain
LFSYILLNINSFRSQISLFLSLRIDEAMCKQIDTPLCQQKLTQDKKNRILKMKWNGGKLKMLCDRRGVTPSELAERLRVSRPTVYNWLSGSDPRGSQLLQLCEILRAGPVELYDTKNESPLQTYLRGLQEAAEGTKKEGRLFQRSGIKLIYAILTDSNINKDPQKSRLNFAVRDLARESRLSTGSVSVLIAEMKDRGFLLTEGRTRILINREALFDQWLHGYMETRFKVKKQCFEAKTIQWWKNRQPEEEGFLWGGEPAAARLTDDFLRPGKLTLYTDQPLYDLVVDADLHQVPSGGNVEFVQPPLKSAGEHGCVHPLLVYADLICSSDDRNTETAMRIYDRYLRHIIESA